MQNQRVNLRKMMVRTARLPIVRCIQSFKCVFAVGDGLAEDPLDEVCELRLVPDDEAALTPLFNAMSDGAALNPDLMDEMNEDEGDFIFDGEEVCSLLLQW
jgi:hypothetical protein